VPKARIPLVLAGLSAAAGAVFVGVGCALSAPRFHGPKSDHFDGKRFRSAEPRPAGDRLAYYQVPRYVQYVDEFPRGPTQRIKKNDLAIDLAQAWDSEKAGHKPARNT